MKGFIVLVSLLMLTGCDYRLFYQPAPVEDPFTTAQLTLPFVLDDQYVITEADYKYGYDLSLFEIVDDTVLTWLDEMNHYLTYVKEANKAMNYMMSETNDTGILNGEITVTPEGFVPIPDSIRVLSPKESFTVSKLSQRVLDPTLSSNALESGLSLPNPLEQFVSYSSEEYELLKPQLDLLFTEYTTLFSAKMATYAFLSETLDHEEIENQEVLSQTYQAVKQDYTALLTCFFNEIYPMLEQRLVGIGYVFEGALTPKREELEGNLFNYIQMSDRYLESAQTFYDDILDYCALLSVIQEFHYLVALTEGSGTFSLVTNQEAITRLERTLSFNQLELQEHVEAVKLSTLQVEPYFLEKLSLANEMLMTYYASHLPGSQATTLETKQLYWQLYGLINAIIRDLEHDSLFNLSELVSGGH